MEPTHGAAQPAAPAADSMTLVLRSGAAIIDIIIIWVALFILGLITGSTADSGTAGVAFSGFWALFSFVLWFAY